MSLEIGFEVGQGLLTDVGRVTDDSIETASLENLGELGVPVEDVNVVAFFVVEQGHLLLLVEVWTDEGITAFDVVTEVRQGTFVEQTEDGLKALLGLAFKDFEEERELGCLDGLAVDVHAEDVVQENAFAFGDGELPVSGADLDEHRLGAFGPLGRVVLSVEVAVPVEQVLVSAEQKGAGTASGIKNSEFGRLLGGFAFEQLPDRVLDDVVHRSEER